MMKRLRDPEFRYRSALWSVLVTTVVWLATHALMVATDPVENTWVFHVLLAISFLALIKTDVDIAINTDIRKEQES
jgi:multisubunit Na+/H+ antiporter MnhE subunit